MTARDIHIGDYILINGKLETINRINKDSLGVTGGLVYRFDNESVQLIPLDDHWLPRLGFRKHHKFEYLFFREFSSNQVLCVDIKEHKVVMMKSVNGKMVEEDPGECYTFNDVEQYYFKVTELELR